MEIWSEGKATYTDADSVSSRLPEEIRNGDKDSLERLKAVADEESPEYRKKAEKEDENWDFDDDILEDAEDVENPDEE